MTDACKDVKRCACLNKDRCAAGQDRGIPGPAEAAQSTKASGDLLRRFKEMGQAVRNDYREPPILSDTEVGLRVTAPVKTWFHASAPRIAGHRA